LYYPPYWYPHHFEAGYKTPCPPYYPPHYWSREQAPSEKEDDTRLEARGGTDSEDDLQRSPSGCELSEVEATDTSVVQSP
jgi:hypothetical protein